MGDRLRAGKPPQYFTERPRPTQPPTVNGTGNEYRPKCGDALRLGIKGRMAHFICGCTRRYQVNLCDPVYTIQPVLKPVEQPVASCKQIFNWLSNRLFNPSHYAFDGDLFTLPR